MQNQKMELRAGEAIDKTPVDLLGWNCTYNILWFRGSLSASDVSPFRNFFSPICFKFFSFFSSWFSAHVGKSPVQYILYGCRELSWQGLSFLTCEKHLVTIKRWFLSLFCFFSVIFFFFALFIENNFSVLLQHFQCLHRLAYLPSGHKRCLCQ